MFLNLLQLVSTDKEIDHPLLGQLTCKSLLKAYKNCMSFIDTDQFQQKQCRPYFNLSISCFQAKDDVQFKQLLDNKLEERRKLLQFLNENKSQLPELQRANQQQFFNLFQIVDQQVEEENEVKNFYSKQQKENKKFI